MSNTTQLAGDYAPANVTANGNGAGDVLWVPGQNR